MLRPFPIFSVLEKFQLARRRAESRRRLCCRPRRLIALPFFRIKLLFGSVTVSATSAGLDAGLVDFVNVVFDQERAVLAHVIERLQILASPQLPASPGTLFSKIQR